MALYEIWNIYAFWLCMIHNLTAKVSLDHLQFLSSLMITDDHLQFLSSVTHGRACAHFWLFIHVVTTLKMLSCYGDMLSPLQKMLLTFMYSFQKLPCIVFFHSKWKGQYLHSSHYHVNSAKTLPFTLNEKILFPKSYNPMMCSGNKS